MSADLTPDYDWCDDEKYDHSCPVCGALVEHDKKRLHVQWHAAIEDLARSYKSPPTYGGYPR